MKELLKRPTITVDFVTRKVPDEKQSWLSILLNGRKMIEKRYVGKRSTDNVFIKTDTPIGINMKETVVIGDYTLHGLIHIVDNEYACDYFTINNPRANLK